MPRPRFSPEAHRDLDDIYVYGTLTYGLAHTDDYANGLLATIERLGANPRIARERDEVRPPIRLLTYRAHNICYDIDGERGDDHPRPPSQRRLDQYAVAD
jgi:toxin ParE1/3/4